MNKKLQSSRSRKEEALLESFKKEKQTIKNLENELKLAENNCKAASQNTGSMQNVLKDAVTKNAKSIIIKEMMNNLRDNEKKPEKSRQITTQYKMEFLSDRQSKCSKKNAS